MPEKIRYESRLAEIRARVDAATEGPWLHGDRWHVQGESHCACRPGYGPLIARRWMDINGEYMWAHVHESPEPFHPHGILALNDGEPLSVVVETTEYGTMSTEDAEFIAASRTDLPALLAAVEAVMELHQPQWHCGNARHTNPDAGCPECAEFCTTDGELYPCPTVQALTAALEVEG